MEDGSSCQEEVWSWGAGTSGQLANGALEDELLPKRVPSLNGMNIKEIAGGGSHVVALLDDGKILTWGSQHSEGSTSAVPLAVPWPLGALNGMKVVKCATGWAHTAFITDDGKVLTCGEGRHGQLGLGSTESSVLPSEVGALCGKRAVDVACGLRHTLVLVEDGTGTQVFSFGAGKRGQLGISGLPVAVESPVVIGSLEGVKVKAVEAGGDHSAAITANGDLRVWGRGYVDGPDMPVPIPMGRRRNYAHVALGWSHGLALTEDGHLWAWGSNRYGQLGVTGASSPRAPTSGSTSSELPGNSSTGLQPAQNRSEEPQGWAGLEMREVPFPPGHKVVGVSAGAEHSAAVTAAGDIFTWGWAEHGQLGLGDTHDRDTPQLVVVGTGSNVSRTGASVFCGSGFTFAVIQQGRR